MQSQFYKDFDTLFVRIGYVYSSQWHYEYYWFGPRAYPGLFWEEEKTLKNIRVRRVTPSKTRHFWPISKFLIFSRFFFQIGANLEKKSGKNCKTMGWSEIRNIKPLLQQWKLALVTFKMIRKWRQKSFILTNRGVKISYIYFALHWSYKTKMQ